MKMIRLRKIAVFIVLTLTILVLILPTINLIVCKCSLPDDFINESYSGSFCSDEYPFVTGKIFAKKVHQEVHCGQPFEVDLIIYNNLWSIYRPGQSVKTTVLCTMYDNSIRGSNFSSPAWYERANDFISRRRGPNEPLLSYVGFPEQSIFGTYKTADPGDIGHFVMDGK